MGFVGSQAFGKSERGEVALSKLFSFLLTMVLVLGSWVAIPTSLLVRPVSTLIEGHKVTFIRETPFGNVNAFWWSEIRLEDGRECSSGPPSKAYYQVINADSELGVAKDMVRYTIGEWAWPCLDTGVDYVLTTHRQAVIFDLIPLRSSRDIVVVDTR